MTAPTHGPLSAASVTAELHRLEDEVIRALAERARFARNPKIYAEPWDPDGGILLPFLDYNLQESERAAARMGRFLSPEENAFFPDLVPVLVVPLKDYRSPIHPNSVNINDQILAFYRSWIVPQISKDQDDGKYNSTVNCDVAVLRYLSQYIHYGKFVAELEFQNAREKFAALIKSRDANAIRAAPTFAEEENNLLGRVRQKGAALGKANAWQFYADAVVYTFRDCIIPFTKQVRLQYLLGRLGTGLSGRKKLVNGQGLQWAWPSTNRVTTADNTTAMEFLASSDVRVPQTELLIKGSKESPNLIHVPFFLKPYNEPHGPGILVRQEEDASLEIGNAFEISPKILVEEYIEGRHIQTVCTQKSDGTLVVLTKIETGLSRQTASSKSEAAWNAGRPAELSPALDAQIEEIVMRAHRALHCRHYSLYRLTIDAADHPYIIDALLDSSFPGTLPTQESPTSAQSKPTDTSFVKSASSTASLPEGAPKR